MASRVRIRRTEKTPTDAIDRLSSLPESVIIIQILSFLETKDAVRTSVLSQRWRSLWTSVPALSLRFRDFPLYAGFQQFIEKALSRRCGKLNKLLLHLGHPSYDQRKAIVPEHVDSWLQQAVNRDVGTIHLYDYLDCERLLEFLYGHSSRDYKRLPEFLFGHSSLTMLTTEVCSFEFRHKVSWGSLTFLSITYSHISYDCLASILSGTPVLQHLKLVSCRLTSDSQVHNLVSCSLKKLLLEDINIDGDLKISFPNLKTLEILGYWETMGQVRLSNLPALVEANLKLSKCSRKTMLQLLQGINHADKLVVGALFCQVLSRVDVNKLHSKSSCSALHIWIEELDLAINKLLQISPFLRTLVINISEPERSSSLNFHRKCWSSPKGRNFKCLKDSLKTVTITGFKVEDSKSLMIVPFVEFLLSEAHVLENLNIYSAGGDNCEHVGRDPKLSKLAHKYFMHKLLNLPRSSQSVVVAFHA